MLAAPLLPGTGVSVAALRAPTRCALPGAEHTSRVTRSFLRRMPREHLVVKLDAALETSHVLLQGGRFEFPVPFGDDRKPYGAQAFTGERHNAFARVEDAREVSAWRNLRSMRAT